MMDSTFPKIISVDDHVVEPPNVWADRLPAKFQDIGPRIIRAPVKEISFIGGATPRVTLAQALKC